ncbi:spore coat protein [Shewanella sp. Sh95]|uniref:UDP-4-amino-4, 6-dideoxy-N-acetyl-beta-L-altrosamine transaminase n=1 Tax=Shewanella sp. Sh95 TaxID=1689868 RepID=UPI0006D99B53|nr:UDP-4-amino-4,6-dideoxy-N-acetyl-beta-L-altrosamine transaminase [Shewanella sp. Sh95]KPN76358.1 spore coat protein [Shewanella sp. Sh95]
MIPYGKQDVTQLDIDAVVAVLRSDYLTQGPKVPEFESAISSYVGANYAVAVNSATSALHIACLALGVKEGDIVWTTPITFVASANCALYCGADIDFVDVDPASGNMCPDALALKLRLAAQIGTLPKVVIPVHLCGHSCDMVAIAKLSEEYGFNIIEDASHGLGGSYHRYNIGSCKYSDITVFSFHPVKIITSAEGGMAMTNNIDLAEKMRLYRSHGITKVTADMLRPDEGEWYYEQHLLGFNYRMTELQAALGMSQMKRLETFVLKRNELAAQYRQQLIGLPFNWVEPLADSLSARHLQMLRLDNVSIRQQLFNEMRTAGIQVHVHYFPVHLQPYYLQKGFQRGDFPAAERFYEQILSLPLYPGLELDELNLVITQLKLQLSK